MNDPDRWPRVKEIFDAALARAPQERAPFIREACPDDAVLREEVESLLAAHADAQGFAENPAIAALASAVPHDGKAALVPGIEFGPYRIIGPLDSGAMGEIYRARDSRLARDVAVKVLPAAFSADPERIARLEREARLLAALNHPHIATIHSLETAGGVCALVMELIEGPTLAENLASGTLTINRALEIARQIADALEAAHDKGIVHRDLKPANIKLTANGSVKILDFGLAKEVGVATDLDEFGNAAIRDGLIAGTPAYMSPEQARGERIDQRADIWAFGCVLYEMLARRRAFGRTTIAETLDAILECNPDWQELPASLPVGVRRLLRRCLEPDLKRRLHHIADARIEIEDAGNDVDDPLAGSRGSHRRLRLLAGLVTVFAIGLSVLLLRPVPEAPALRIVDITTPWTYDPQSFALSPDGRRVAFVGDHQGQPMLWVRPLDADQAQLLPGTQGARRPFWSPDSQSIGFFAFTELKRIDTRGGAPQPVAEIIAGTTASWGAGGNILFSGIMSRTVTASANGLLRVNADGGVSQIATRPTAESSGHRYPHFLPGGREFLFYVDGSADVRGVHLGSLDSPATTRLVPSDSQGVYLPPHWLLFARRGTLLAQRLDLTRRSVIGDVVTVAESVASDPITGGAAISTSNANVFAYRSGRSSTQVAWFDRTGRALGTAASFEGTGLSNPRLSPDGRRVIGERTMNSETSLWLIDPPHQVVFARAPDESRTRYPVWSRDGDRIAYVEVRSGSVKLLVRTPAGTGDRDVSFDLPPNTFLSDWSQDGRFLLYFSPAPKTGTDIWVVPMDTRVPRVFHSTPANEMWGQFSPDGRWIAYHSNETGRFEIYVKPFPGPGGAIPISTTGGIYTRWSRDGNELFYVAPDATMMSVRVRHSATTLSADKPVALFKTRRVGGGVNIIGYGHQYDVAPDGRFLINVEPESNLRPITLVINWNMNH